MALTITNTFTDGGTIEASELNANFNAVATKFDGNIANADISSSAAIANSKLANSTFSFAIPIQMSTWDISGGSNLQAFAPLPYYSGDTGYSIVGIEYAGVVGTVTGSPTWRLASGTISDLDSGTPTYHCAATALPLTLTEGRISSPTNTSLTTASGTRLHLGIVRSAGGSTGDWVGGAVGEYFTVTVTLISTLHS